MPTLLRREYTHAPPPPVAVDLARVMLVGCGAWLVALVVTVLLAATGTTGWEPAQVCVAGLVLGLVGVPLARRKQADASAPRRPTP
ncbi:DUF2530 domain-containing protein [Cellulomonas massiliensis]|uniref:DUF2530 domain-containing protein n=1 Tax=Cellulomonas massiliensis TaxID=1465811 RepID=UPI0002D73EA3|nr:DUF2530 domain-containing protein [Cellulomonas massiliensis]